MWEALRRRQLVDIVFCNACEAIALTGARKPEDAALDLAQHTKVVSVVTDGHRGSHLAGMGASQLVPPHWMPKGVAIRSHALANLSARACVVSGRSIRYM